LRPEQFEAVAALMPPTPENRELIADQRDEMQKVITAQQVTAEGADVIGAVLDHGATGLELPRDAESWNKYVDRRLISGDSVSEVAIDVLAADQSLPTTIIAGMAEMNREGSLDMPQSIAVYAAMGENEAKSLASSLPQPEIAVLLADTAQNYDATSAVFEQRMSMLELPAVRKLLPTAAIYFDGGTINGKPEDRLDIDDQFALANEVSGANLMILTGEQRESIRESFKFEFSTGVALGGVDLADDRDNVAAPYVGNSILQFLDSHDVYRTQSRFFGRNTGAFTNSLQSGSVISNRENASDMHARYQKALDDWGAGDAIQPGMMFDHRGMKATPANGGGITPQIMLFDPEGKKESVVLVQGDEGFNEARNSFYGLVPPHQRVERPDLSYQASYGNVHPSQISPELNNGLMLEAVKKWTSLSGRNYTVEDQQEVLDMYSQLKSQYGWPSVPPPE